MALTRTQRRKALAILDDVLLTLLPSKKVKVRAGNGYVITRIKGLVLDETKFLRDQLVKILRIDKPCEVCMKGALFLGYVDCFNKVKPNFNYYGYDSKQGTTALDTIEPLLTIWPKWQLNAIEALFENYSHDSKTIGFYNNLGTYHIYANHPFKFSSPRRRLTAILEYMKANGGEFVIQESWK